MQKLNEIETRVLESTIFMQLCIEGTEWSIVLLDALKEYKRKDTKKEISSNGFNIKEEAKKLTNKYLDLLK